VHTDMVTVTGRAGWTSQTGAVGCCESYRRFEQAICNCERAEFGTARVAVSTAKVTGQTASDWADVEPAKLYHGVGLSDLDSGIADVMSPAYFGQPRQL